MKITDCASVPK